MEDTTTTTTDGDQPVAPSLKDVALKAGDDLATKLISKAPPALQGMLTQLKDHAKTSIQSYKKSEMTPERMSDKPEQGPPIQGQKKSWGDRHPKTKRFFQKVWGGIKKVFGFAKPLLTKAAGAIPGYGPAIQTGLTMLGD